MTVTTTQTMLSNVVYGQASGNYDGSSQLFYSNAVPAANYYAGNGNIQTIRYNLSGFVGTITIEATLNDLPEQAKWFEISERGDGITPDTGFTTSTVTGNFSWVRARVEGFDAGTITLVSVVYQ
jgi:hypothetical protein